jgi:UDP-galactopyranose mutase
MKQAIILGGGFAGCVWAHLLGHKGWKVDLYEAAPHLGGGCRTHWYGGHPYTLGPRHLFTPYQRVFEFFEERLPQRRLDHYLLTYVERDHAFYSYPMHSDDVARMPDAAQVREELAHLPDPATATNFEACWLAKVGPTLYNKFVKNYSRKMWQIESNTVLTDFKFDGKGIGLRTGTHQVRPDLFVSYPHHPTGWNPFFDEVTVRTPGVTIHLNTPIAEIDGDRARVRLGGDWRTADLVVSSLSPDDLFQRRYGELQYIGRDFMKLVLPIEHAIPDPTYFLHYANDEPFTRVVEYKKLTGHRAPDTLLGIEIPSKNNKLYPYPVKEQQDLAARYFADLPANLLSVGRMGNYRYFDIGMIVDEALTKSANL